MLGWGCGLASPRAVLNVGPGLEKAENEEDNRGNPWMLRKSISNCDPCRHYGWKIPGTMATLSPQ